MVKKSVVNTVSIETNVVSKKRGRKPKNVAEEKKETEENINVTIEETTNIHLEDEKINDVNVDDLLKCDAAEDFEENDNENQIGEKNIFSLPVEEEKPIAKKRGRKPKGGKIIQQIVPINNNKETKPNVILHLKCSLKDLQNNSIIGPDIESYNFQNQNQLSYDIINNPDFKEVSVNQNRFNSTVAPDDELIDYDDDKSNKESDIRDIWKKLKVLEHNLHINNIYDKKSACFWCTYEFDNPPVYIPKHFIKESYHVYGCFCSPECATAHLMEENIDSSSKFERYHLINHIYSKIYDYKKNVKPAPNPYYMLEKYYGNLTIQEYRALLRNERLFLIVDKPLTRILPELHEDNDDFIINNKIIPSNTYQIKKKLQKKQQTKTNILSERFGLAQQ
jgi:hypothetical protein